MSPVTSGDGTILQAPEGQAHAKQLSEADLDLDCQAIPASATSLPKEEIPIIPGYQVLRRLGKGSYGEVWFAREDGTGIQVAIKRFFRGTGGQWQLLQEEIKRLAELDGVQGIIKLKDVFPDANPPYYVMEYAEGGSLADRLKKGPLPVDEALAIFCQVTSALAYVHAKTIRHCDLKPGNILLDARGRALIADFGQAYLSGDDIVTPGNSCYLGSYFYMAPEQVDLGSPLPDTHWDVYGLGALFYTMVIGRPPRQNEGLCKELEESPNLGESLRRYRAGLFRAPPLREHRRVRGMDRPLADIIDRCLKLDPQCRLRDAGAVLAELDRRQRKRRQRPLLLFGLIAPLLLVTFMAYAGYWGSKQAVDRSQIELTAQLLESDRINARLVANVVQEQMQHRVGLLRAYSSGSSKTNPYPQILAKATREERYGELKSFLQHLLREGRRTSMGFSEATITNAQGQFLAYVQHKNGRIEPMEELPTTYAHYSWRDWFSGLGDRPYDPQKHYPPIAALHLSDPYVSLRDGILFVSISLPIRDPASGKAGPVLGVLEAAIKLDQLNQWLLDVKMKNGFAVLLDQRHSCVIHPDRRTRPEYRKAPPKFNFSQLEQELAQSNNDHSGKMDPYRDPVDGRVYLAAYAPMRNHEIGWIALIQHDREAALRPIEALRGDLGHIGWTLSASAAVLVMGLWGWLLWLLYRTKGTTNG